MSKLLLSGDNCIYKYNHHYYASNQETFELFCRYLSAFDSVKLVSRCVESQSLNHKWIPLENEPRIEFFPLPEFHGPKEYLKVFFKIRKLARKCTDCCDAAILRVPSTVAMLIGKFVLKKHIPYAVEVVYDAEDGWRSSSGINKLLWKKIDMDLRTLCYKADGVSCVTEKYMQRNYFSKKKTSFSSHYSSLALTKSFYRLSPKKYPSNGEFVIAHTANQIQFNGRKGQKEVVDIVSILKQKGYDVKVKFAGKNYDCGVEKLKKYAQEIGVGNAVEFVGYLDKDGLNNFLESSDLFVLPTKTEGLPRVIIEAMAKGLPCVSTNVSGNSELISRDYLVDDFYDVESFAKIIWKIIHDPQIYESLSSNNLVRSLDYENSILQQRRDLFYASLKKCIRP